MTIFNNIYKIISITFYLLARFVEKYLDKYLFKLVYNKIDI